MRDIKKKAADEAQNRYNEALEPKRLRTKKRVCVVGAGPGGVAAAYYLARNGVAVDVFEKRAESHGIVRYAIPSFRISKEEIDRDLALAKAAGVNFHFNADPDVKLDALKDKYDYIVLAIGAWAKGRSPVTEGSELVLDSLDFLLSIKKDGPRDLGKKVAVIGAGDVAMDCARLAKRMPESPEVTIVYRRTEMYAPASQDEFDEAMAESVEWCELHAPVSYDGKNSSVKSNSSEVSMNRGAELVSATGGMVTGIRHGHRRDGASRSIAFQRLGALMRQVGQPVRFDAMESSVDGVYVIGDCRSAFDDRRRDGRRQEATRYSCKENLKHDFDRVHVAKDEGVIVERRGVAVEAQPTPEKKASAVSSAIRSAGSVRKSANRANVAILVDGFDIAEQIVHVDGMCNECGNCATFCPHAGKPYKDKLALFWSEEDFVDSENIGFLKLAENQYRIRDERGRVFDAALDGGAR